MHQQAESPTATESRYVRGTLKGSVARFWPVVISRPVPYVLAVLSGVIYATAFPPLSWSLAAWIALVPLHVACASLSPWRAAIAGMCWTATLATGVGWFLPGMLSDYFGLTGVLSWLASLAIVAGLHGIYVSGYAAWVAALAQRGIANPILLAGGWLVYELARTHGPLGSPWALTAYSQIESTALIQIADLAGPYGIGLLVAGVNACAAALIEPRLRGRRPLLTTLTIATALLGSALYGEWRLGQSFADGPNVPVALIQGGASSGDKAQRAARLSRYAALTTGNGPQAKLIVWPEYAVEAYLEEASPTRDQVLRVADEARADLILGSPHYTASESGTLYHNSAYLVREGRLAARYDKHRLVPFAEEGRLGWLLGGKTPSYTPGVGDSILPASPLRVGTSLCLESVYPGLARDAARQGAEVLVNLSNDAWFGHRAPARHQLQIATLRAVETRRYLVRAAATGFSAVIDPHGRTLAETEFNTHQALHSAVRASHATTPYQRWGDALAWMVVMAVASATLRAFSHRIEQPNHRRFS